MPSEMSRSNPSSVDSNFLQSIPSFMLPLLSGYLVASPSVLGPLNRVSMAAGIGEELSVPEIMFVSKSASKLKVRILTGFAHITSFLVRSSSICCFVEGHFGCLASWDVFRDIVTKYIVLIHHKFEHLPPLIPIFLSRENLHPINSFVEARVSKVLQQVSLFSFHLFVRSSRKLVSLLLSYPSWHVWDLSEHGMLVILEAWHCSTSISRHPFSFHPSAVAFIFLHPVVHCATFLDRVLPDIEQVGWLCRLILKSYL
uniref:Transmembrane protein n=1 Tax=Panagrellus redivivus TaxID=6233 RepID=A0A7E4W9S0_PANRE